MNPASGLQSLDLLQHLPVGVYRTCVDGRILQGNRALAWILGCREPTELLARNVRDLYVDEEDRTRHLEALAVELVEFREFQFRTFDGRRIWVRDFPRAVLDEAGDIAYFDGALVDVTELKRSEAERERLIAELQEALEKVRTLGGLLPICCSCKKVRDDRGYWEAVEAYLARHSGLRFSHGLCPGCLEKLYPEEPPQA